MPPYVSAPRQQVRADANEGQEAVAAVRYHTIKHFHPAGTANGRTGGEQNRRVQVCDAIIAGQVHALCRTPFSTMALVKLPKVSLVLP